MGIFTLLSLLLLTIPVVPPFPFPSLPVTAVDTKVVGLGNLFLVGKHGSEFLK